MSSCYKNGGIIFGTNPNHSIVNGAYSECYSGNISCVLNSLCDILSIPKVSSACYMGIPTYQIETVNCDCSDSLNELEIVGIIAIGLISLEMLLGIVLFIYWYCFGKNLRYANKIYDVSLLETL